jgi:ABC-type multidrug transport system fused ATPase/permease subunit
VTATGYEKRIAQWHAEHGLTISKGKTQRLALRLAKRQAPLIEDFDEAMRNLGIISDPTPREAIRNLERAS